MVKIIPILTLRVHPPPQAATTIGGHDQVRTSQPFLALSLSDGPT